MVETNEQKIAYLKLLKEAIDSGNCKIVGNRITFYLPKDKAEKAD
jgi:16S rRNA G527 N7-methylase RsmG